MRPLLAAVVLLSGCDGLLEEIHPSATARLTVGTLCPVRLPDGTVLESTWDPERGDVPAEVARGALVSYLRHHQGEPFDHDPELWSEYRIPLRASRCRTRRGVVDVGSGLPPRCVMECD